MLQYVIKKSYKTHLQKGNGIVDGW
jgi:hypothetical protein